MSEKPNAGKVPGGEARIVKEGVVLLGSMELYVPVGDEKNAVDAWNGVNLGSEADELVAEILRIGHEDGFRSVSSGGKFDEKGNHIRAREIGERLRELGGHNLMMKAWWRVEIEKYRSGLRESRSLEFCWDLD